MKLFTKNRLRITISLVFLSLFVIHLSAQRTITGTVLDPEFNEPLIGVTVVEKENPNNGAVTNLEGKYTIKVSAAATALIFRYTGFDVLEIPLESSNFIDAQMKNNSTLTEFVKIGYGTVKREDATGLVQTVGEEQFNRGAITSAQELIAGKIPGVVVTPAGNPGGGVEIRIRGESSLSASNKPLIVIDGVPIDNGSSGDGNIAGGRNLLNLLNPNDIESFTVLKDASSTAIYGNRASGGVILITTKKGSHGKKISVGLNSNISFGKITRKLDVLNANEFRSLLEDRVFVDSLTSPNALNLLGNADTDWQDEIYRTAVGTDHNLSLSGGIGTVPYRVSLGYTNKNGVLLTDNFKRYTGAINLNPGFFDNTLQVNLSFKGMLNDNHFADNGAIGEAVAFDPTQSVLSDTTAFGGYTAWTLATGIPNSLATTNPVARLNLKEDVSTVKRYVSNANINYRFPFLPALKANLVLGYDYSKGDGTVNVPNFASFAFDPVTGGGQSNLYNESRENSLLESFLNYKKAFGEHDVDVVGGYSWQRFEFNKFTFNRSAALNDTSEYKTEAGELYLVSTYGRINYGFRNRYLFTATLRADATSRFGPDFRLGYFPALAFATKIIDNKDKKYFNKLKGRLSWGRTGQQDVGGYYAHLATYESGIGFASTQFGTEFVNTIRPNGYVANLQWEEAETYNVGFDFGIIKNRLSGSLDIYRRNTYNLLNRIKLPAGANLTDEIEQNIGNMKSNGIELAFNTTPILQKSISWDLGFNLAYNYAEVTKLINGTDPDYTGENVGGIAGGVGSNIQNHFTGFQPYSFFVFEQKYENGKIVPGEYVDRNKDGAITELDKYRYKSRAPRFTLGLTSNFSYKDFDLSFAGRSNIGNYVYHEVLADKGFLARTYHPSGYLLNLPSAALDLDVENQADLTFSDAFVKNASFFRLDHITAGYTISKFKGRSLRLYGTVQNVFLLTKYDGLDPEQFNGIDGSVYPRPRTLLLGFNVQF